MKLLIKLVIIITVFNILFSLITYLKDTKEEIKNLEKRIAIKTEQLNKLEETKTELVIEAKNLESLEVVEKIARNKLNMKKEGEEIYRIVK